MAKLTETENELIDLLKARKVDKDGCVATILYLKEEKDQKALIDWIKDNPEADDVAISQHIW